MIEIYTIPDYQQVDLDAAAQLRITKGLEQNEPEQSQVAAISFAAPMTPANLLIFERWQSNTLDDTRDEIDIECRADGKVLALHKMQVVEWNDKQQQIEIEVWGDGWVDDLEKLSLRDIDLGEFTYTQANIESAWADTTTIAVPVLAHYGAWYDTANVLMRDLRIWFNLAKVMRAAFQAVGWSFESSYFDGPVGSRLYGYLSPEKWHSYRNKNDQFRVDVEIATPQAQSGNPSVILFDEVNDPLDLYDNAGPSGRPSEYLYPPAGENPITFRILVEDLTVTLPAPPAGEPASTFYVLIYKNRPPALEFLYWETVAGSQLSDEVKTLSFEVVDGNCLDGDSYGFIMGYEDLYNNGSGPGTTYPFTLEACTVTFSPDPPRYIEDDDIYLADLLDGELNALDLFVSLRQLIGGKTETDLIGKVVRLWPPFQVEQQSETIEGFFQRELGPVNLNNVQVKSRIARYEQKTRERFVELDFAEPVDEYVKRQFPREPPYRRVVDLVAGENKTKQIVNKVFSATIEKEVADTEIGGTGLTLPVVWDSEDGTRRTVKAGYRIGYHYGLIEQILGVDTKDFSWEGVATSQFGYVTQVPQNPIDGVSETVPIAFSEFQFDLWRLFYRRQLLERARDPKLTFDILLTYERWEALNFRRTLFLSYAGSELIYQLEAVRNYDPDRPEAITQIELRLLT